MNEKTNTETWLRTDTLDSTVALWFFLVHKKNVKKKERKKKSDFHVEFEEIDKAERALQMGYVL